MTKLTEDQISLLLMFKQNRIDSDQFHSLLIEILSLRQQVEKARAQGRDEGLEEAAKVAENSLCQTVGDHRRAKAIANVVRALKSGEGV